MSFDPEFGPPRQDSDHGIGLAIREFDDHPAGPAHEMVAMAVCGCGVVAMPMVHVHVFHQAEPFQEVHGPIDAGQADPAVDPAGAPMDLGHFEMLGRIRQDPPHGQPGARELQSLRLKGASESRRRHRWFPQ
jgi:hypothetical protein